MTFHNQLLPVSNYVQLLLLPKVLLVVSIFFIPLAALCRLAIVNVTPAPTNQSFHEPYHVRCSFGVNAGQGPNPPRPPCSYKEYERARARTREQAWFSSFTRRITVALLHPAAGNQSSVTRAALPACLLLPHSTAVLPLLLLMSPGEIKSSWASSGHASSSCHELK